MPAHIKRTAAADQNSIAQQTCFAPEAEPATIAKLITPPNSSASGTENLVAQLKDQRKLLFANIKLAKMSDKEILNHQLKNKNLELHASGRLQDRHKRLLRQVVIKSNEASENDNWLQHSLVAKGSALVYALPTSYLCAPILLAAERKARLKKRGQWAEGGSFIIHEASDLQTLNSLKQGSFHLVRGQLKAVAIKSRLTYLNFSDNWRKDFTAIIESRLLRRKDSRWPKLKQLVGKNLIMRGWIDHWNGPMIRLETPEMLMLDEQKK
ncbi:MAG: hypothetical protein DHS20C08_18420 [Rhodomicrobium sp.]|nr:MAG: hypothetical protein DHS20C08_18420 [Rhodomicrobium sp.]